MPKGVYDRASTGLVRKKKKSPRGTIAKGNGRDEKLAEIDRMIADLRERRQAIMTHSKERANLLAYCQKAGLDRADVGWVYHRLPVLRRVSRSDPVK